MSSRYPSQANMPLKFGDRLWIVRKRVLAFEAVFFGAAAVGALLVWYVSEAKADPGPVETGARQVQRARVRIAAG